MYIQLGVFSVIKHLNIFVECKPGITIFPCLLFPGVRNTILLTFYHISILILIHFLLRLLRSPTNEINENTGFHFGFSICFPSLVSIALLCSHPSMRFSLFVDYLGIKKKKKKLGAFLPFSFTCLHPFLCFSFLITLFLILSINSRRGLTLIITLLYYVFFSPPFLLSSYFFSHFLLLRVKKRIASSLLVSSYSHLYFILTFLFF